MHTLMSPRVWIASAAVVLVLLLWAVRALRRARAIRAGTWVRIELHGRIAETDTHVPLLQRWIRAVKPRVASVRTLRRLAQFVARDRRVDGVLLEIHDLGVGFATATSLRTVITELRAASKRVIVWLPRGGMTRELYVAMAAEKIYTTPQAGIAPLGIASAQTFYRTLLARGGIEAEALSRREYKSAIEPFTRDGASPESREQTEAILDGLHGAVVQSVADARGWDATKVRAMIDAAPFRPVDAVKSGLIDGLAYEDELALRVGISAEKFVRAPKYAAVARPWAIRRGLGRGRRSRRGVVGVVEVRGAIVAESPYRGARAADAVRVIAALRAARENRHIGAVVLFVDSPGGSALASDLIAREVERLREKKPVVAFMSDVAASGGYYVSALANEIVAQPTTITGSIGVFALRFVVERALEKLGITHEVVRRGARADVLSPYRKWTDDERAALDREIDGFYRDFVAIVARGRKRTVEEIEPLARGRVYTGEAAQAVGLVDTLGGLDVAIARAATLANLDVSAEPVAVWPPREMPEPPEPIAHLQPVAERLGIHGAALTLALTNSRERFYAFDPTWLED